MTQRCEHEQNSLGQLLVSFQINTEECVCMSVSVSVCVGLGAKGYKCSIDVTCLCDLPLTQQVGRHN